MNLAACKGKLVRVRWRDVVEDSRSPSDPVLIRQGNREWAMSDTYGVLLEADADDVFVATTLGATETLSLIHI